MIKRDGPSRRLVKDQTPGKAGQCRRRSDQLLFERADFWPSGVFSGVSHFLVLNHQFCTPLFNVSGGCGTRTGTGGWGIGV